MVWTLNPSFHCLLSFWVFWGSGRDEERQWRREPRTKGGARVGTASRGGNRSDGGRRRISGGGRRRIPCRRRRDEAKPRRRERLSTTPTAARWKRASPAVPFGKVGGQI